MPRGLPAILVLAASAAVMTVEARQGGRQPPLAAIDFARDIQPLLQAHCYECHGPAKVRGRLRLDLRAAALKGGESGPVIIPGNSESSLLVRRVLGLDGDDRMPKDGDPLPEGQIALLRAWIDRGAPWPDDAPAAEGHPASDPLATSRHWAYRAPGRPPLPDVRNERWTRTEIDRFVLARLEREGLEPAHEAPLTTLVRRVSLDLIGLPPSPADVDAVEADAARDGLDPAYARLVDRLLASPHYGERWARPWLDLARYADSHGFEKDLPRVMWKYRDWVIDALNRDMPFDRFTIEQIAGDMLANATIDQIVASGFHRNAMTNEEGGIDPEEARYEVLVDRVNTTATVWLGTTLACAQCHDHKYDPFSQRDYFRMLAFFSNTAYDSRTFGDGTRYFEAAVDVPTGEQEKKRAAIQADIDRLTDRLKAETPALARDRALWEAAMRSEAAANWSVLTAASASADGGVDLTPAADGSILASGANPGDTTYTIAATPTLPRVTAIRVEALPHPSLPKGGPGRDVYGNFQMNGIEITAGGAPVAFAAIRADDSAGGANLDSFFPRELPRDSYAPRGWRIDASREETRLPRQIVFTLAKPLAGATALRLRLKHEGSAAGQAIGRFRISVTASATPQRVVEIPARLRPILAIAPSARTEKQRDDLAGVHRTVAASLTPVRDRLVERQRELRALGIPTALVMRERPSHERPSAFVRRRGSFLDRGEQVYADVPEVLHSLPADRMPNRLGLAYWLVDRRNPLTARVAVNRAWEQIFGRGLVETSEDLGTQGAPPSHPELLDWLAVELMDGGWQMKALHRLIVTSATYRQAAAAAPALVERDPYNRLLARGPRFRMEAEMVRDGALAASGLLSRKVGGPSVFPTQPDGIWDIPYSSERWVTSEGEDRYRRGLYTFIRRSATYPSLITFDGTSRESCTVRRVRTNTPLQALTTLNDPAFFEAAQALGAATAGRSAGRDFDTAGSAGSARIAARATYAFRRVLTRMPSQQEIDRIVAAYADHVARFRADPAGAAKVIGQYAVAGVDAAEQAAWTIVANSLLNLDEALTKE
jgi:hypothetical protein